jgi:glycopeptide antibiotics resistance protein
MLWFLSGVLLLRCLWAGQWKWQAVYIAVFYFLALTIEISQLGTNVPGTFDPFDLLFMGITALLEGVIYNSFIKRRIK